MNRQDKHINKFLRDPLPDPEIPADDAWAGMSDMLGGPSDATTANNTGQEANGQGQLSSVWKAMVGFKGLLTGISIVLTLATISWIVLNTEITNDVSTVIRSANTTHTTSEKTALEPESTNTMRTGQASAGVEHVSGKSERIESSTAPIAKPAPTQTQQAIANTPRADAAGSIVSKNSHIEARGGHSGIPAANADRRGAGRADVKRTSGSYKPTSASAREGNPHSGFALHTNERGALTNPGAEQHYSSSQEKSSNTGKAIPEAVSPFYPAKNTQATPEHVSISSLKPLPGRFESGEYDLSKSVQMPVLPKAAPPATKAHNPIWKDIHFGPEWTVNRAFASTQYMLTGSDSVNRPWRLAIPGLFVSKSWDRHSATFIFNPTHAYFGEKERVAQRIDTIRVTDSIVNIVYRNTNFIKSIGINFTLQYQYQAAKWLSLVGGLSYARYSAALLQKEMEFRGNLFPERHLTVRGREALGSYIRPQQWNVRVGLLSGWPDVLAGRLQVGFNVIIPVSDLSLEGFKPVKSPNLQMSLRFLIK